MENLLKETGGLNKKEPHRSFKKIGSALLRKYVKKRPDAYQREIAGKFGCSVNAISKALKREKITLKKRQCATGNKTTKK